MCIALPVNWGVSLGWQEYPLPLSTCYFPQIPFFLSFIFL